MNYKTFLKTKGIRNNMQGFKPLWLPDFLYDFQSELVDWSIRKGKAALFEDCGLGKSPQQLVWAENVIRKTNGNVLILTPLAVSYQTIKEAKKFNIEARRTQDGKVYRGINITNYERLSHYDPDDFNGVVCDECFSPDTKINIFSLDNSLTSRYIKDIKVGDLIYNVKGKDYVKAIAKRPINRAIQVGFNGKKIICSENHLFFTLSGWKAAKHLRQGDSLLETETAMCLLRNDFPTTSHSIKNAEVLRNVLLSEMANVSERYTKESTQPNCCKKARIVQSEMASQWECKSQKRNRENTKTEPHEQSYYCAKNDKDENRKWYISSVERKKGWQRSIHKTSIIIMEKIRSWLEIGIGYKDKKKITIPNSIQSGHRKSEIKNSNRNRWQGAYKQEEAKKGHQKTKVFGVVRVDSIKVLEQGNSKLERYRDEDGFIYFYDIEAEQHPSFSVNNALVHNSSILKNCDGKTRKHITDFMYKINYRLLCSATPAPNDFVELGTSSEALGEMTRKQMLGMFFTHDGSNTSQWNLKGHAKKRFWQWVSTWARAIRKPSDLGYDDSLFILPALNFHKHTIKSNYKENSLLPTPAIGLNEQRAEKRRTLVSRCEKVASLVPNDKPCLIWCHLNDEGNLLEKLIPDSVQVSGSDKDEVKEQKLTGFSEGDVRILITKPKIGGFGMNWQHCSTMTFFPSHSHEQFYQASRRCWRFGQKNEVDCHLVASDRESIIMHNMLRKERQAVEMYNGIIREMSEFQLGKKEVKTKMIKMEIPAWL